MVCVIALAMSICSTRISATQFAIYMSLANLGHSAGSKIFGSLSEYTTFVAELRADGRHRRHDVLHDCDLPQAPDPPGGGRHGIDGTETVSAMSFGA